MKRSWLAGGIAGLILSGIILVAAWTGLEEKAGVETGVQYASSLKIAALFVAIVIIFLHLKTKTLLENELASSARAFGNFFLESESLRQGRP